MNRKKFLNTISLGLGSLCFATQGATMKSDTTLIVYFSWSGNTRKLAQKINALIDADIEELKVEKPYSRNYNKCLEEAKIHQRLLARPKLVNKFSNIERCKTIFLGYPNWWGSIPMPVATFLESYNFEGKIIIPFCSHGGGRLAQSIGAISKSCPKSTLKEALCVYYGGDSRLDNDIASWISKNGIFLK